MRTCPDCSAQLDDNAAFCDNCGLRLMPPGAESGSASSPPISDQPTEVEAPIPSAQSPESAIPGTCSACGYANIAGEMFCENCGVQLAPVASVPPPPPTPMGPPAPIADSNQVESAQANDCMNCGYPNKPGDQFCDNCGTHLVPASAFPPSEAPAPPPPAEPPQSIPTPGAEISVDECPNCGHSTAADEQFCLNCGFQLTETQSAAPSVQSQAPSAPPAWEAASPPSPPAASGSPPPPSSAPAPAAQACSNCGYARTAGEMFCDNCGMQFEEASLPVSTPAPAPIPQAPPHIPEPAFITGKLVIQSTQAEVSLPAGKTELLIGRSDPVRSVFPDIDLTIHGGDSSGVSRKHARLSLQGTQVYIEDLNSTNFTFLNKQRLQPGQRYPLNSGDEIRLGLLVVEYRTGM